MNQPNACPYVDLSIFCTCLLLNSGSRGQLEPTPAVKGGVTHWMRGLFTAGTHRKKQPPTIKNMTSNQRPSSSEAAALNLEKVMKS